nr:dihydroorotase [Halothermothrix orenii]
MRTLLKNGTVIDPVNNIRGQYDILIEGKHIINIKKEIKPENCQVIKLEGKVVIPGLIDMHTHLREPGYEEKETIITGCEAAAAGGFTTIACMPNTRPVADNPATVEYIKSKAREAVVKVLPVGSITKNLEGKELAEIGFLARAGVCGLSDDGNPVMNSEIMRRAMEYARAFDLPIISHCEDLDLVGDGVMNEGYYSTILGLKPIPAAAEEVMISRDIILADFTGARLHIDHLSTRKGVEMVARAKEKGLRVTAEVTPHHLILTDKAVKGYNPNTRVNPPLRSSEDRAALRQGIKEGIIDVIATDHAPHTFEDKLGEYDYAENGISGLETALSLIYDRLIKTGEISWEDLVRLMVINPSEIVGVKAEGIKRYARADITIFDPDRTWQVNPENFKSKGKNTPFADWELTGKVVMTIVDGKIVYDDRSGNNEVLYR